jgi:hypothetical protein
MSWPRRLAILAVAGAASCVLPSFEKAIPPCQPGFGDCDGNLGNGCETPTDENPEHCGACGSPCLAEGAQAVCAAGQCSLTCEPGFADCDEYGGNGCEVMLATDGEHCNGCANDCLGGGCADGVCGPIPTVVTSGLDSPFAIALDSSSLYVTEYRDAGRVLRIPIGGGAAVEIAANQTRPRAIAVDATSVYWANEGGTVMKAALDGASPVELAVNQAEPYALAITATDAYFTTHTGNELIRVPLMGGPTSVVAPDQSDPHGVFVDQDNVYWSTNETVRSIPLAGGAVVPLASGLDAVHHLAVDATHVYLSRAYLGEVMRVPIGGGELSVVSSGHDQIEGIAAEAGSVYFADSGADRVLRVAGGKLASIASAQQGPSMIALDAANVYFTNYADGTVMRVKK